MELLCCPEAHSVRFEPILLLARTKNAHLLIQATAASVLLSEFFSTSYAFSFFLLLSLLLQFFLFFIYNFRSSGLSLSRLPLLGPFDLNETVQNSAELARCLLYNKSAFAAEQNFWLFCVRVVAPTLFAFVQLSFIRRNI